MKHVWGSLLLLFPLVCAASWNTRVSGWGAGIVAAGSENFDDREQVAAARGHLQLGARGETFQLYSALEYPTDSNIGEQKQTVIREAWIRARSTETDFTLGRQLFPEGRSDWIHPQNQFAPRDYTQLTPFDGEQRLGLLAARLDYYPTMETMLTLAAISQDRGHVLFGHPELPGQRRLQDDPASALLVRVDYRTGAWEHGFSFMNGRSPTPSIRVGPSGPITEHYAQKTFGIDGSYSVDGDLLRWDFAYLVNDEEKYPGIPRALWVGVVGLDKRVWANAIVGFQVIHESADLPSLSPVPELAATELTNRQLSQVYRARQSWFTVNLRQTFRDTHFTEFGHLQGENGERIDFIRWSWAFTDGWKFSMQALSATRGEGTLAGSVQPSDMLFSELRFYF